MPHKPSPSVDKGSIVFLGVSTAAAAQEKVHTKKNGVPIVVEVKPLPSSKLEAQQTDDPNAQKEVAKGNLKQRFNGMKVCVLHISRLWLQLTSSQDNLLGRVPDEHKDKADEHYQRSKKFLTEEYFPEERRDQFIFRAKKVRRQLFKQISLYHTYFVGHRRMSAPRRLSASNQLASRVL